MPRHPLGDKAMTDAERQQKRRERLRKENPVPTDRQKFAQALVEIERLKQQLSAKARRQESRIERAVQRVHDEYRVDAIVRQHFTAKGRPEPTISNPVAEVNAFHRELVRFTVDVSARLTTWMESGPRLDDDGKAALMQALYLCADECAELAQKLDGR